MGVHFEAEGLPYERSYDCGYITYGLYRLALARAMSPVASLLLRKMWLGMLDVDEEADEVAFDVIPNDGDSSGLGLDDIVSALSDGMEGTEVRTMARGRDGQVSVVSVRTPYASLDAFLRAELGDTCCECLFYAPDDEGELTARECAELVADIERHLEGREPPRMPGHNYGETRYATGEDGGLVPETRTYDMHEQFMGMFRHCAENEVRLTWG